MKFANKAGLFFVAAGISFGASAMQDTREPAAQWEEQVGQRTVCEEKWVPYCLERTTNLGSTTTVVKEYNHQLIVTTTVEQKIQTDTTHLDRKRCEEEFPRQKLDIPCDNAQSAQLQMVNVDQAGVELQQQGACSNKRAGSYHSIPTTDNYTLALANEVVEETFDSETQTVKTVTRQIFEKKWNTRDVSEVPACENGAWSEVCGKEMAQCSKGEVAQVSKARRHKN